MAAWLTILAAGFAAVAGIIQVGTLAGTPAAPGGLQAIIVGRTLLACAALGCGFGLLRRREWARKGMVLVLAVAVALVAAMVVIGAGTTSLVVVMGLVVVMAWLAVRLNGRDLKAEFR